MRRRRPSDVPVPSSCGSVPSAHRNTAGSGGLETPSVRLRGDCQQVEAEPEPPSCGIAEVGSVWDRGAGRSTVVALVPLIADPWRLSAARKLPRDRRAARRAAPGARVRSAPPVRPRPAGPQPRNARQVREGARRCAILGIGRISLYKLANDANSGLLPKVRLTDRIVAWRYDDIEAWADCRPSATARDG